MILAEVGYDQNKHDAEIEKIRRLNLNITQTIESLVAAYELLYSVDDYSINSGMCEDFGSDIISLFPEAVGYWDDEFTGKWEDGCHYFIFYKNKFYDSESPEGVASWQDLPLFQRQRQFSDVQ